MSWPKAEGAAPPAATDLSERARALAAELEATLADAEDGGAAAMGEAALQALAAAVCRAYSARYQAGDRFPALAPGNAVMDTDVMIVASALLKAVNLEVFELGMWQSWTGH